MAGVQRRGSGGWRRARQWRQLYGGSCAAAALLGLVRCPALLKPGATVPYIDGSLQTLHVRLSLECLSYRPWTLPRYYASGVGVRALSAPEDGKNVECCD